MGLLKLQNTLLKNYLYINIVYRYCIDISQYFPPIYRYVKCPINDSSSCGAGIQSVWRISFVTSFFIGCLGGATILSFLFVHFEL